MWKYFVWEFSSSVVISALNKTAIVFCSIHIRGENGSLVQESTLPGFHIFLLDLEPKSKICEEPEPLFIYSSSRSLCGLHTYNFLSKNIDDFRLNRWQLESEQELDSQIKKILDPDLDSKIWKWGGDKSLKLWLWPPLIHMRNWIKISLKESKLLSLISL